MAFAERGRERGKSGGTISGLYGSVSGISFLKGGGGGGLHAPATGGCPQHKQLCWKCSKIKCLRSKKIKEWAGMGRGWRLRGEAEGWLCSEGGKWSSKRMLSYAELCRVM